MGRFAYSFAVFGLFFITACGGDEPPTISIAVTPTAFGTGGQTTLTVTVTHFSLVDPSHTHALTTADHVDVEESNGTLTASEGHYHVYLDTTEQNPLLMAWTPQVQVSVEGSPGPHQLIVRLNANDHRFLKPEVKDQAEIMLLEE